MGSGPLSGDRCAAGRRSANNGAVSERVRCRSHLYRRWGDPAVVADSILVVDFCYRSSRYFGHSQSGNPIDSPDNGPDPIVLVRGV